MNATMLSELAQLKEGARATWAAGDYPTVARKQLWEIGPRIVQRAGVRPGEDVLDVACGTGNAALRAAQAGATVVGVDLTPELFDAGRELAGEMGVHVDFVQGDAEALPFADASFDVVLSTFGCMFAPRHAVAAQEIARVLRPGGRLAIFSWTPEGAVGRLFATVGTYMPPPSPLAEPPVLWGTEDHVEELFAGTGVELEFERGVADPPEFESADEGVDFFSTTFGPMMMARELTEAGGTWGELRARLVELFESQEPAEYLAVLGRKE